MLIQETAEFHKVNNPGIAEALSEPLATLRILKRRIMLAEERFVLALVGWTNVGKSTLLNALLGYDLAPRRNGPCTAVPIEFESIKSEKPFSFKTHRYHSIKVPTHNCSSPDELRTKLDALANDAGAQSGSAIRKIVVQVPADILSERLVIADTPGFGAAQLGGAAGTHDETLRKYIVEAAAQVLWVVLAEQGIGESELTFFNDFLCNNCEDIVVTGSDGWPAEDRQRFQSRYEHAFKGRPPAFHFVSGLEGWHARQAGDDQALDAAGIKLLDRRLRSVAGLDYEGTVLALARDASDYLTGFRDDRRRPLRERWRPDSFGRWASNVPVTNPLKAPVSQILASP